MKKSALTVGAITLLSQGIGLAAGMSGGSYQVVGSPIGKNPPNEGDSEVVTDPLKVGEVNYYAKAMRITSPADGVDPAQVSISASLHSWKDGDSSANVQSGWTLTGILVGDALETEPKDEYLTDDKYAQSHTLTTWTETTETNTNEVITWKFFIKASLTVTEDNIVENQREAKCRLAITKIRYEDVDGELSEETFQEEKYKEFSVTVARNP